MCKLSVRIHIPIPRDQQNHASIHRQLERLVVQMLPTYGHQNRDVSRDIVVTRALHGLDVSPSRLQVWSGAP
jgi:hypothetical protein